MTKQELINLMKNNPVFHLATEQDGQPYVRGMFLYNADENDIIFHTGSFKEVYSQIEKNNKAELCFNDFTNQVQLRIKGNLEKIEDKSFKDEIAAHPTRAFLKGWKDSIGDEEFYKQFTVYTLKNAMFKIWTMESNFTPGEYIQY